MCKVRERKRKITLVFLLIASDQILKLLALHEGMAIINKGVSFGILLSRSPVEALAKSGYLVILLIGLSFYLLFHFLRKKGPEVLLILAGGISNLLDRMFYGGVVDFITLPFIPVFNLADILVVVGCVLIFIDLLKLKKVS